MLIVCFVRFVLLFCCFVVLGRLNLWNSIQVSVLIRTLLGPLPSRAIAIEFVVLCWGRLTNRSACPSVRCRHHGHVCVTHVWMLVCPALRLLRIWINHIPCKGRMMWTIIILWHEWLSTTMLRLLHVCVHTLWCLILARMWVEHMFTMSKLRLMASQMITKLWSLRLPSNDPHCCD